LVDSKKSLKLTQFQEQKEEVPRILEGTSLWRQKMQVERNSAIKEVGKVEVHSEPDLKK